MTCQEFWDTMPELEGEPGEAAALHLSECASCATVLRNHRTLAGALRGLAGASSGVKAPSRVEGRLLAAFRGQAGLVLPKPTHGWWPAALAWASAVAVVAIAFLLFQPRAKQPETPRKASNTAEMAALNWSEGLPAEDSAEPGAVPDGQFIPLPNADRLPQNEQLNLVRVEVPRSAMIALGYSVTAERAQERVRADVVLGSDGLARAVRFLDE